MEAPFTAAWIAAFAHALAASESYRRAAARWEGDLILELTEVDPPTGVYLDLHRGACRAARLASAADFQSARYILAASRRVWDELLDGSLPAGTAVMSRALALKRGGMLSLLPHLAAAQELVEVARQTRIEAAPPPPPAPASAPPSEVEEGGFDPDLPARLWQKAKRDGIWNPLDIDLSADRRDWLRLEDREQQLLLHLGALFGAGEQAVVQDLLPLIQVIADEGRLEEEMYLTSFLWEEAKHVEAFRRFLTEVAEESGDLVRFQGRCYRTLFGEELPRAMRRLRTDASPEAQAIASTTYNLVVEGVLAETGYHAYGEALTRRGVLPGMQRIVGHLKGDESRHLAYGVHLLSRLAAAHGEPVRRAIRARMEALLPLALGIIEEAFAPYLPAPPFGLSPDHFMAFASREFDKRLARIERAG